MAKEGMLSSADLRPELIHSAGGLLVLLVVMTLSAFKPWGMTPYGRRVSQPDPVLRPQSGTKPVHQPLIAAIKSQWLRIVGYHAIGLLVLFAVVHVAILHFAGVHHH
jgi:hypothetical protein